MRKKSTKVNFHDRLRRGAWHGNKFETIDSEVTELTSSIHHTDKTIAEILKATGVISDNISQLSASSEEVAAASGESVKTASDTVSRMEECNQILENIKKLAEQLEDCAKQ